MGWVLRVQIPYEEVLGALGKLISLQLSVSALVQLLLRRWRRLPIAARVPLLGSSKVKSSCLRDLRWAFSATQCRSMRWRGDCLSKRWLKTQYVSCGTSMAHSDTGGRLCIPRTSQNCNDTFYPAWKSQPSTTHKDNMSHLNSQGS